MDYSQELLMEHEPELGLYEGYIEGCQGCAWMVKYNWDNPVSAWQQYLKHLEDLSLRIFVWSPERGAQPFKLIPEFMNATPDQEEIWLAGALENLGYQGSKSNHIYFFAMPKEMFDGSN